MSNYPVILLVQEYSALGQSIIESRGGAQEGLLKHNVLALIVRSENDASVHYPESGDALLGSLLTVLTRMSNFGRIENAGDGLVKFYAKDGRRTVAQALTVSAVESAIEFVCRDGSIA